MCIGFEELRSVVRFLSVQNDEEDCENDDITAIREADDDENMVLEDQKNDLKRLDVTDMDGEVLNSANKRRSVRRSSFRSKKEQKRKRLQRLASMPGFYYIYIHQNNKTII